MLIHIRLATFLQHNIIENNAIRAANMAILAWDPMRGPNDTHNVLPDAGTYPSTGQAKLDSYETLLGR